MTSSSEACFAHIVKSLGKISQSSGGLWRDTPFSNRKKAWEKSRAHEKTHIHKLASERALAVENARRHGHIETSRSAVAKEKAKKNEIRCVYFLARISCHTQPPTVK